VAELHLSGTEYGRSELQVLQQWCTLALRACRTPPAAVLGPVPAPQPLRLRSFVLDFNGFTPCVVQQPLLQALAAAQTEGLFIHSYGLATFDRAAAAVLGRFTSLETLQCDELDVSTALELPASLCVLKARFLATDINDDQAAGEEDSSSTISSSSSSTMCMDLQHLTRLQHLVCRADLAVPHPTPVSAMLPPQLTRLEASAPLNLLGELPALQHVGLGWHNAHRLLPSLSGLPGPWGLTMRTDKVLRWSDEEVQDATAAATEALGTATSLTSCTIDNGWGRQGPEFGGVQWCAALSSLPRLQRLEFVRMVLSHVACFPLFHPTRPAVPGPAAADRAHVAAQLVPAWRGRL
jgi:hypothetical protein